MYPDAIAAATTGAATLHSMSADRKTCTAGRPTRAPAARWSSSYPPDLAHLDEPTNARLSTGLTPSASYSLACWCSCLTVAYV